jgi:ParB family transcriptional regulator, chromosome partitioning protein
MNPDTIVLPLDRILVGKRLRAIDYDYVSMLAASMLDSGQHTPIHVGPAGADGMYPLIAGGHRYAAAKLAGIETLTAQVFEGDALSAQLLEIDENLMRRGLSEMDRAVFLARRKDIYEALHPETGMGKAPKSKNDKSVVLFQTPAFSEDVAEKVGLSRRSIERAIKRASIEPDLREMLAGTRWADNGATLDGLVRLEPLVRAKAVVALTRADGPAANLAAAVAEATNAREGQRNENDEQLARLQTGWRKAGRVARRSFLRIILETEPETRSLVRGLLAALDGGDADEGRVLRAIGGVKPADTDADEGGV